MNTIEEYQAVIAMIDAGGLTAAARQLGRSLQAMSRAVAQVERELGVELIRRTTRCLQPTEAGLRFQARMRVALADIEAARIEVTESASAISRALRVWQLCHEYQLSGGEWADRSHAPIRSVDTADTADTLSREGQRRDADTRHRCAFSNCSRKWTNLRLEGIHKTAMPHLVGATDEPS
jgi:hypothetical protein